MKLLILGGTGFLGYHVVAAALDAGHEVSAFTRQGQAPLTGAEPLGGIVWEIFRLCTAGRGTPCSTRSATRRS